MNSTIIDTPAYVMLAGTDELFSQRATVDLAEVGYQAIVFADLEKAQRHLQQYPPVMVLIDRHLTEDSGSQFCQAIRQAKYVMPVLFVILKGTLEERVNCFESGADDYLLKPYNGEKFLQLIHIYLQPQGSYREQLCFADLVLDINSRQVWRDRQNIDLTVKEFELLKYLMNHAQQVLTREQILENVWGDEFQGESNVIEVYIRYLRLKIEDKEHKRLIQTVRGVGYVLKET